MQWKIKHTHTHVPSGMEDNFKDDDDLFLKTATSPGMERGMAHNNGLKKYYRLTVQFKLFHSAKIIEKRNVCRTTKMNGVCRLVEKGVRRTEK